MLRRSGGSVPVTPDLSASTTVAEPPPLTLDGGGHGLLGLIKLLSSAAGLRMFKTAYRENMLHKILRYEELLARSHRDVQDAVDVIRIKMPDLKRAAGLSQTDLSDNWHIFDSISGPYHRAKEQASQFEAILNRARERLTGTMELELSLIHI